MGSSRETDEIGAATGLVYTESGGDTVTMEVHPPVRSAVEAA
jgi:ATP-dependent Lon protease